MNAETVSERSRNLKPDDARRGIYIDFEGWSKKDGKSVEPAFVGIRTPQRRPLVRQYILDPSLRPFITNNENGERTRKPYKPLRDLLESLLERDAPIIAWSTMELELVRNTVPKELADRFESKYVNAKRLAERWINKRHGGHGPENQTLGAYLSHIGYRPNEVPAGVQPAKIIERCRTASRSTRRLRNVNPEVKGAWMRLLEYNRFDVHGLRRVTQKAANSLNSKQ